MLTLPELHPQWQPLDFPTLVGAGAAFVNLDSQNSILDPGGVLGHEEIWRGARETGGSLYNILRLAATCRRVGIGLIWLRYDRFIGEREPGTLMDQAQFRAWNGQYRGDQARKRWEADLVEEVKATMGSRELTLVYPAWSIFIGTPLLRWLEQMGSRTLILSGYHTDWCVETAARNARDFGYMPIVVGDACGSTDSLHTASLAQINDCYAPVISTDFCIDAILRAGNSDATGVSTR